MFSLFDSTMTGHQGVLLRCSGQQCRNTLFVDCSSCENTDEKCTTNEVAWNRGGFFEQKSQWWCSHCMKDASSKYIKKAQKFSKSYFRPCCRACLKATSTQKSHVPALDITFGANCNYDQAILLSKKTALHVLSLLPLTLHPMLQLKW